MGAKMGGGSFDDINMTPLIDIVLVVLIIMMVNIPIQVNEMGVKLPGPKADNPPPPPENPVEQLVVALYEDGKVALNRKAMTDESLFFELTRRLRAVEKKNVFIDAHPTVAYGGVVDLMDMAREAGAAKVGLARMKIEGPASVTSVGSGAMPFGVFPGNPTVVGAMKETDADNTLKKYMGNITSCYKQGLAENPSMSGRVLARLTVAPDGSLMGSKITQSSLENDTAETCIEQVLEGFTFPPLPPQKTAIVQYPLVFSPGK